MDELTADEIFRRRDILEHAAATLLGQMIFEFARLEMALAICLAWSDKGKRLEEVTRQVSMISFHKKLEFLDNLVSKSLPVDSIQHAEYSTWIEEANAARLKRNEFVHGRWGVDAVRDYIINVIGIPNSAAQREVCYRLSDLESVLKELQRLQRRLNELRSSGPL